MDSALNTLSLPSEQQPSQINMSCDVIYNCLIVWHENSNKSVKTKSRRSESICRLAVMEQEECMVMDTGTAAEMELTGGGDRLVSVRGRLDADDVMAGADGREKRAVKTRYECRVCGNSSTVRGKTRAGQWPYACNVCSGRRNYGQRAMLPYWSDGQSGPYACDLCGRAFPFASRLTVHKRTHTGERPYLCDVCGRTFTRSSLLAAHRRTHHGPAFGTGGVLNGQNSSGGGRCLYACHVCGKTFSRSGHLKDHGRTHTDERPYLCDVCGKTFRQTFSLTEHMKSHTGEKPYACDVCGKTFTRSGNFVWHRRTHTGERPYLCDVCGRTFTRSANLTKHRKTVHSDERPTESSAVTDPELHLEGGPE